MSKIQLVSSKTLGTKVESGLLEGYFCDYYFQTKMSSKNESQNIKAGKLISAVIYKDASYYNKFNVACGKRGILFEINKYYNPDFYANQLKAQQRKVFSGFFMKLNQQDVDLINEFIDAINQL